MSFFNEFPHTRTYDSDLGWLIKHVGSNIENINELQEWAAEHKEEYKDLADKVEGLINNLVDVVVPWDSSIAYHIFSIVEYQGTNYIAVQDVPIGTMITNTDYWQPANTVVEQVNAIGQTVNALSDDIDNVYEDMPYIISDRYTDIAAAIAAATESDKKLYITGTYDLSAPVFAETDGINNGEYPEYKIILKNHDRTLYSGDQLMVAAAIDVDSSMTVQTFTYDSRRNLFYMGMCTPDNLQQKIYSINAETFAIEAVNAHTDLGHINTFTYNPVTDRLICMPDLSQVSILNPATMTVERTFTLAEQVAGIQYDETNNIYVGVLGPNWNNDGTWKYIYYDADWNYLTTYLTVGHQNSDVPNGFYANDGKIVSISYKGLKEVDYFGNVISEMETPSGAGLAEWEGVAFKNNIYYMPFGLYSGKICILKCNALGPYRPMDLAAYNWLDVPINWEESITQRDVRYKFNPLTRQVRLAGWITLRYATAGASQKIGHIDAIIPSGALSPGAAWCDAADSTSLLIADNIFIKATSAINYTPIRISAWYQY